MMVSEVVRIVRSHLRQCFPPKLEHEHETDAL